MKINSIEHHKKKNSKNEQEKRFKDDKKCYNCDKKNHFAQDCRSKNKKNRRQINVLIKVSDKIEIQEEKSDTNTFEVSTNDKYYRVETLMNYRKFWMKQHQTRHLQIHKK